MMTPLSFQLLTSVKSAVIGVGQRHPQEPVLLAFVRGAARRPAGAYPISETASSGPASSAARGMSTSDSSAVREIEFVGAVW